jgi:hypothetical protein
VHAPRVRFTVGGSGHIVAQHTEAPMSVCPSCNQQSSDPRALFCAYCGFALPEGPAAGVGLPAFTADSPPVAAGAAAAQGWHAAGWSTDANPRAVAAGLGALVIAAILAVGLSYSSTQPDHVAPPAAAPSNRYGVVGAQVTTALGQFLAPLAQLLRADAKAPPRPLPQMSRYRATGYSFAYPSRWQVAQGDRPVTSYRETLLQSTDGTAKVTVDYSPGETTDPASKASQVEAPTSSTPGYRRISFGPTSVNGHRAFAWDFVVADADPRRADLFLRTRTGDFALLAHGVDFARARSAARLIAGSLDAAR